MLRPSRLQLACALVVATTFACATPTESHATITPAAQHPAPATTTAPAPSSPTSTKAVATSSNAAPAAPKASVAVASHANTSAVTYDRAAETQRVIALGQSDSRVMEHLDQLANRIGPRLTGSHAYRQACEWARDRFASFGLKDARLEQWGEFPVGFNRGAWSGHMLAPETMELHFATNAWTAGTRGPLAGPAVLAPTNEDELAAVRSKLKGAWVIVAPAPARGAGNRPARNDTPSAAGSTSEAPAVAAGSRDAASAPAAGSDSPGTRAEPASSARGGASGGADRAFRDKLEKVYDEEGIAGTVRSGRGDLVLTGGNHKIAYDKLPTRPSITLLAAEHKDVSDRLKAGADVRLEFDVRNWFDDGPIPLDNVIAEIPGVEKPDEVVIVGGHLDSWDGATGATDNGTGVATTLEAARLLVKAGVHPKRTIRFMLWGGEEQGLLGSRAYVQKHKDEMPKISAVLVHDEGTNYCAGIPSTPAMKPQLEEVFAPIKDLDPEMPFKIRETKGLSGGGSDHSSFLSADVPGLFWDQKGRAKYVHTHHTQFDTYDAAIPEYQKNSSIVIAVGALGIANLPDLLSRESLRAPPGGGRRLGVQLADNMAIEEVVEGGLAEKAGFKVGDRIVKIGSVAVADQTEMRTALQDGPAKTTVAVLRGGQETEIAIEFPANSGGRGGGLTQRLGLRLDDEVTIEEITAGGAAEKAGLKVGDKLVKIGDTDIEEGRDLFRALGSTEGNVQVVVKREGKDVTVTLVMPEQQQRP